MFGLLLFSFGTQDRVRECNVELDLASEDAPDRILAPSVVGVEGCAGGVDRSFTRTV